MKIEAEFWKAVSDPTPTGCREWTLSTMARGYGQVNWRGKIRTTHRLAYEFAVGPIPPGMFVCHHCDNRRCCNPDHLFVGTAQDNHDDMIAKGRKRYRVLRGSDQGNAKLTEAAVMEIRRRRAAGELGLHLAAEFGVSPSAIACINVRKTWRHV